MFPCQISSLIKLNFVAIENGIYTVGIKTKMAYVILLRIFREG